MQTIQPNSDAPGRSRPHDAAAGDGRRARREFPHWRSYVGEFQHEGTPIGQVVKHGSGPAGVMVDDLRDDEDAPDAVPLMWDAKPGYLALRTPEGPEAYDAHLSVEPAEIV